MKLVSYKEHASALSNDNVELNNNNNQNNMVFFQDPEVQKHATQILRKMLEQEEAELQVTHELFQEMKLLFVLSVKKNRRKSNYFHAAKSIMSYMIIH